MPDIHEIAEAMAARLEQQGIDAHPYVPAEDARLPRLTVYDGDGNVVFEREVGPLAPYDGPTMTVRLEHSDEWTELWP